MSWNNLNDIRANYSNSRLDLFLDALNRKKLKNHTRFLLTFHLPKGEYIRLYG